MATGPDLIQVAVPSLVGVSPALYRFHATSHELEDVALGPEGEVPFSERDWVQGLLSIEEGLEDRRLPKYVHAQGVDPSFPGQVIVQAVATTISVAGGQPALAAPKKQIDWIPSGGTINTYLIGDGRYVHRLSANQWTSVFDAGSGNVTADIIGANDFLELGLGPSRLAQESSTGAAWVTLSIFADRYAALNNQLWRAVKPNLLYDTLFSSNPYAWSSAYTIGDSTYDVTSLTAVEQLLMIGKEDGMYSISTDGSTVAFSPELRPQANADFASQRATGVFNNDFYFRTLNGLMQITATDGLKNRVGLDTVASPDLPTPVVKAVCADDRYLYAILDNTANGLMIVRRSSAQAWHPWYWDPAAGRASHIAFSGALGYPAIFFSYDSGGGVYVTKFIRTSTFPNPLQDSNYRYDTGASFYIRFPRIGNGQSDVLIDHFQVKTLQCAAGRTIQLQTNADEAGWVNFGSAITTSPNVTVIPTVPVSGAFIDVRAILTTNSATVSPVLKGLSARGTLRPKRRSIHTFQVTLARDDTDRQGVQARGTNKLVDDLTALRSTNAFATVKDENGRQFDAVLLDVRRARGAKRPDENYLFAATLKLAEKVAS